MHLRHFKQSSEQKGGPGCIVDGSTCATRRFEHYRGNRRVYANLPPVSAVVTYALLISHILKLFLGWGALGIIVQILKYLLMRPNVHQRPTVVRAAFITMGLTVSYDTTKETLCARQVMEEGAPLHIIASIVSGVTASILCGEARPA